MYVCRKIDVCSRKHICGGKKSIAYSEFGLIVLGVQHALHMRHIVICGISGCTKFFHIITLIDVAIQEDRNVTQKEAEKKIKYESLCVEVQRMWKMRCVIRPVITGATAAVKRF